MRSSAKQGIPEPAPSYAAHCARSQGSVHTQERTPQPMARNTAQHPVTGVDSRSVGIPEKRAMHVQCCAGAQQVAGAQRVEGRTHSKQQAVCSLGHSQHQLRLQCLYTKHPVHTCITTQQAGSQPTARKPQACARLLCAGTHTTHTQTHTRAMPQGLRLQQSMPALH